ncbi:MAG: MFS transporter [Sedimentisphaerales bacterium]|nr:MFS transporter [Sedimentisphaerales bacterium]
MNDSKENTVSLYDDRRLRFKTMRYVVIEGVFSIIAIGLQQAFFIPCLNSMGATSLQIGIGAGIPAFSMGLVQMWVPVVFRSAKNYKKIVLVSVCSHAFSFLPFAVITYLNCENSVWLIIAAASINALAMGVGAGMWADWMSYLVPGRRRGVFFAKRNRILVAIQVLISLFASTILDRAEGKILLIFSLIWTLCFLTRMLGGIFIALQYEPLKLKKRPTEDASFIKFIKQINTNSFGRFVLAFSLLNFAANISGPFFAVYMLNDLHLSYMEYTILFITPSISTVLSLSILGRLCDRVGYVMPMRLFTTFILGLPLVWIFTKNYWMLLLIQIVAGITWGGMALASFNYTLDAVDPSNRLNNISYLNVISSVCIFMGATLGGFISPYLPVITSSPLHSVFLFSVLLRFFPLLLFQTVSSDKPKKVKMTAFERFFFDPKLSLRDSFDRAIFGKNRRSL